MRILHINCNYICRPLHQLMIEKLDALGFENQIFVPTYDKNTSVIEPNENVLISECFKKNDRYVFDYKQAKIIKAIEESCDVRNFDLIHAYTLFTDGNVAKVLSEKYDVPYVVAVRNTDVNCFFEKRLLLRRRGVDILLSANKVFFLSESYKKQVVERYVPSIYVQDVMSKTLIIPNGIDDFWYKNVQAKQKAIDSNCLKLVFAGEINKNKNIVAIQMAMDILRKKGINAQLTVVGKITQKTIYERIIKDEYTKYISAQPKEKLIDIYGVNDVFVMPSKNESFGLVYAEAMTQGLPVIYTRGQGFDKQFEDGYVGYAVDSNSPEEIAEKIKLIVENYSRISGRCANASEKFVWDKIASEYKEVYENEAKDLLYSKRISD